MDRKQIEMMVRTMMPRPFHQPNGMAACVDIAQGGTEYLKFADPCGGPMMRALARWADWWRMIREPIDEVLLRQAMGR